MGKKASAPQPEPQGKRLQWDELDGEGQVIRLRQAVLALASTLKNQHDTTGIVALLE